MNATATQPWLIEVEADDNAMAPVVTKEQKVAIDCSERDLVDGGIYALKCDDKVALWLFHEGFGGVGPVAGNEIVGTLSSLAGKFRCSGPVATGTLKVIGRCADDLNVQAIDKLSAQRDLLLAALDECRNAIRRQPAMVVGMGLFEAISETPTLENWRRRYDEILATPELSKRFALEQRIDAISARLMFLEERIADAEANSQQDVAAKLQVLWDLHHAPFPATHGDLSARILATALRGLKASSTAPEPSDTTTDSPAIKLVSSPRRR